MSYEHFKRKFSSYSSERLLEMVATEKQKPGWTTTRAAYLRALKQVVKERGIQGIEDMTAVCPKDIQFTLTRPYRPAIKSMICHLHATQIGK